MSSLFIQGRYFNLFQRDSNKRPLKRAVEASQPHSRQHVHTLVANLLGTKFAGFATMQLYLDDISRQLDLLRA